MASIIAPSGTEKFAKSVWRKKKNITKTKKIKEWAIRLGKRAMAEQWG